MKKDKEISLLKSEISVLKGEVDFYKSINELVKQKKAENHCLFVVDKGYGVFEVEASLSKGVDSVQTLVIVERSPIGFVFNRTLVVDDGKKLNEAMKTGFLSEYVSQLMKEEK